MIKIHLERTAALVATAGVLGAIACGGSKPEPETPAAPEGTPMTPETPTTAPEKPGPTPAPSPTSTDAPSADGDKTIGPATNSAPPAAK